MIAPIFNHMVEKSENEQLTDVLKATSDPTRRALLTQLVQQGPTKVTDLAGYYEMSLNAISKHIKVLESAGLVTRKTIGRTHWIEANLTVLTEVENWFRQLKSIWELRMDQLENLLTKGDDNDD